MEDIPKPKKKIDSNAIVSPKTTKKLYGENLDIKEPVAGQSDEINTELPEDIDNIEENLFPSAP
ncbi:hypothetical protein KW790_01710 [Candidatus Parcubacteria bacterium]|nr:hypothetical protein [Candidatus Parcubacteria bacterium]